MILSGLRFGDGRAVRASRETLRELQPKTVGETLQAPPPCGPSECVEGAPDTASSSAVQVSSIARRRLSDTCTEASAIGQADQMGTGLPRPACGRARGLHEP